MTRQQAHLIRLSLTALALLICYSAARVWIRPLFGIRITSSPSLPYKLFISRPISGELAVGNYVSCLHTSCSMRIAKEISGLPGDAIKNEGGHMVVAGQERGQLLTVSPNTGKPLTPQKQCIVPEGYVYLYAPHPESFDSRYEEFGLVKIEDVDEVLWPIF